MHRKIKILLAAAAIALPAVGIAAVTASTPVASAVASALPVMCKVSATVTFNPPLTKNGVDTTNKAAMNTATITNGQASACVSSDAHGAPTSGTFGPVTIKTAATKGAKVNKVQHYTLGSCPGFASVATFKALKGLTLVVHWTGGAGGTSTFVNKTASAVADNVGEVGFALASKAGPGSYSEKALDQVTAFLDVADSTALASGCAANQTVHTVTVDVNHSTLIL